MTSDDRKNLIAVSDEQLKNNISTFKIKIETNENIISCIEDDVDMLRRSLEEYTNELIHRLEYQKAKLEEAVKP